MTYYKAGSWNSVCDVCGYEYKSSELRLRWDGLMVCYKDFEVRHPQDFVRGVADFQAPIWSRPETKDKFIAVCTLMTIQGAADLGTADCAQADRFSGIFPDPTNPDPTHSTTSIAGNAIALYSIAGSP